MTLKAKFELYLKIKIDYQLVITRFENNFSTIHNEIQSILINICI
jgi:hypothetical protein